MNSLKSLKDLLFLDIETVTVVETYDLLDKRMQPLWERKSIAINEDADKRALYFEKGGIYAEFGKIVTISVGFFFLEKEELHFKVKSFCDSEEKKILSDFNSLLNDKWDPKKLILCAHNGKEFDYPYLCRRMIINNIKIPDVLDICGKKPWEVRHLDTLEMWKFGDRKNYTSLELLAAVLGIASSKDSVDGSMVNMVYYKEKDIQKIAKYCEKDVIVTAQVYLKLTGKGILKNENVHLISSIV
jgi:predicted PolB exonuclease-like 3'-5' exonuclease